MSSRTWCLGLPSLGYVIEGGELGEDGKVNGMMEVKKWGVVVHLVLDWFVLMVEIYLRVDWDVAHDVEVRYASMVYRMICGEDETFESEV